MLFTRPSASVRALRLPAAIDPLHRVHVPCDLRPLLTHGAGEVDAASVGMSADGVERIWRSAVRLYRHGVYPALAVCIRRNGRVVLDRSIGWSRGGGPGDAQDAARVLATPRTPFCIFSASKAITATVVHLLAEQGRLDLDDRVAAYLPEFARPQFDEITIDHVLSHRAGVPFIPRDLMDLDRLGDREFLLDALSGMRLRNRPGSSLSYHAVSGGFILGEVVQAVTGKYIRTVLDEQILAPLAFRWTNYGAAPVEHELIAHDYATGPRPLPPLSTAMVRALGLPVPKLALISRDPRFLNALVPAANVVSTANELSRFMDLLRAGGTLDGVPILTARTIRRALVERSYHEFDRTLGVPLRHASGFMLGARTLGLYGPDTDEAFGHLGFTNVMAWADPRRELAVAIMTNGKPVLGPHLPALWALTRRIGLEAPKVADPELFGS
ncbi:MAG: serine hydrolase domain-containing protein [Jatrophihabitantaceae bacterium]